MVILLSEKERKAFHEMADSEGIDRLVLIKMYQEIMSSNFEQDLWDIIVMNKKELDELSNKKGEGNE